MPTVNQVTASLPAGEVHVAESIARLLMRWQGGVLATEDLCRELHAAANKLLEVHGERELAEALERGSWYS